MRGKPAKIRKILPDPRYNSITVSKLINRIMIGGQKTKAMNTVYTAMEDASKKVNDTPLNTVNKAISEIKPMVELRPRRVGGATYQVPVPVTPRRQEALAVRWLVEYARSQKGTNITEVLTREIISAYNATGEVVKKRENVEKMAEANRAFAHFR
ncbi:MAG TPA: 30S ribosomal protein S7 [Candidatus Dojkabacteria bacterium]|nr:30S ribosomal protein S7 [Candidatus Dojkabacteria bacterium]HQF36826.1 30S ribosomal protein S7 [Candidatus Dojkabacteria bacterium]